MIIVNEHSGTYKAEVYKACVHALQSSGQYWAHSSTRQLAHQQGEDGRVCDGGQVLQALDELLQVGRHGQVLQRLARCRVLQDALREGVEQGGRNLRELLHLQAGRVTRLGCSEGLCKFVQRSKRQQYQLSVIRASNRSLQSITVPKEGCQVSHSAVMSLCWALAEV